MAQIAKVQRVYHSGYVDILLPKEGQSCGGGCAGCEQSPCPVFGLKSRHATAENTADAKWGDVVEVEPVSESAGSAGWAALALYAIPVAAFLLGCIIGVVHDQPVIEVLLSGLILGMMALVLVWMTSRGSRLGRQLEFRVVRILTEA